MKSSELVMRLAVQAPGGRRDFGALIRDGQR
jgi:hypothetical protein